MSGVSVVSYRNSTSNHNVAISIRRILVVVSYRNSTSNHNSRAAGTISAGLYLIEILHQTTTQSDRVENFRKLYLIEILHQTTTHITGSIGGSSCILSKFYIKPQRRPFRGRRFRVVSYRNSTSNHNFPADGDFIFRVVSYRNSTSNHNCIPGILSWPSVVSYRNSTSNHNVGPHID